MEIDRGGESIVLVLPYMYMYIRIRIFLNRRHICTDAEYEHIRKELLKIGL